MYFVLRIENGEPGALMQVDDLDTGVQYLFDLAKEEGHEVTKTQLAEDLCWQHKNGWGYWLLESE